MNYPDENEKYSLETMGKVVEYYVKETKNPLILMLDKAEAILKMADEMGDSQIKNKLYQEAVAAWRAEFKDYCARNTVSTQHNTDGLSP